MAYPDTTMRAIRSDLPSGELTEDRRERAAGGVQRRQGETGRTGAEPDAGRGVARAAGGPGAAPAHGRPAAATERGGEREAGERHHRPDPDAHQLPARAVLLDREAQPRGAQKTTPHQQVPAIEVTAAAHRGAGVAQPSLEGREPRLGG